uniref:ABC transporter ATP-binding protein n=1 Tax=Thalassoroseus pseudoceratinae TaxID=2713176 RepID=UPI0014229A92
MTPLLEIQNLRTYFKTGAGVVKAVDDLSISIPKAQTLGLVGESGSGKSVTSLSIMRLLPEATASIESGSIAFLGRDLVRLPPKEMRNVRGADISMIFQEPGTSLNPVYRTGWQVMEAIRLHNPGLSKKVARERTIDLFREVGIPEPERRINSFPHEMSGGQKQRVMIAMALSCNPKLLIADEPTTALDVTIQAQILDLLRRLRDERGMSILFITHDLGVIAEIADHVAVMYRGKLVEQAPVRDIFENPQHPYTKGLLACRPRLDTDYKQLPTVSDFMRVTTRADGSVKIEEKPLDDGKLEEFRNSGRPRLLHPKPELDAIGHPWEELAGAGLQDLSNYETVAEGIAPILSVKNLKVYFPIKKGIFSHVVDHVRAVDDVSFNVYPGQTLGLVGESGCGKTTTGRGILRLVPPTSGEVYFEGVHFAHMHGAAFRQMRRRIQIIFQDPYNSLNPRMTVEAMLTEVMKVHGIGRSRGDRRNRAADLLDEVGLGAEHLRRYPHEFSGGQRQRICIARAIAVEPDFIICDESVSALDVSVQAQVLNLLNKLQLERKLTYIFISHDLSVVKFMSDMMAVMNAGKILEFGPSDAIYANPREEYTKKLIDAIPNDSLENIDRRQRERNQAKS